MRKRRIFAYELMACSLMMAGIPAYASTTTSETKQESQNTNEQPPEKPDGEAPSGADGQQGEKPDVSRRRSQMERSQMDSQEADREVLADHKWWTVMML